MSRGTLEESAPEKIMVADTDNSAHVFMSSKTSIAEPVAYCAWDGAAW
jgi:hypothetical protein